MSKPVSDFLSKFWWLCLGGIIYLGILILLLYFFFAYGSGLLLLYMPLFICISAFIGVLVWCYKFSDKFQAFLVYVTYVCSGFAFVFLVPFAVERSLSTFILFYANEHGSIPQVEFSLKYKDAFFQKRFDDAVKGNFLIKEGNLYKPTLRTKIYYNMLYPLGKMTNMLGNYEQFVKEVESVRSK